MTNSWGDVYTTGTVSIDNGSNSATFVGTLMTTQAEVGDFILLNGLLCYVETVVDDLHLTFFDNWEGTNVTAGTYTLIKISKSRYDVALNQDKQRKLLAFYEGAGFFYFVTGSVPDPSLGTEGQWALKTNVPQWQLWYYTGGVWVEQATPVGIDLQGLWSSTTTYSINQTVSWQGKIWKSRIDSNLNHQPDSSPTQWLEILSGGDRYDIAIFDTDRPASGELVAKLYPKDVQFYVGMTESYVKAEIASTGTVFYSIQKNDVEFGRITFSPGNAVGVITCPTLTTFGSGDKFTVIAPASRDATLSGVGGNLIGYR